MERPFSYYPNTKGYRAPYNTREEVDDMIIIRHYDAPTVSALSKLVARVIDEGEIYGLLQSASYFQKGLPDYMHRILQPAWTYTNIHGKITQTKWFSHGRNITNVFSKTLEELEVPIHIRCYSGNIIKCITLLRPLTTEEETYLMLKHW